MAENSGLTAGQNAYYQALLGMQGQGSPDEILNYVKGLSDYQSLASLANTQGKYRQIVPDGLSGYDAAALLSKEYGVNGPISFGDGVSVDYGTGAVAGRAATDPSVTGGAIAAGRSADSDLVKMLEPGVVSYLQSLPAPRNAPQTTGPTSTQTVTPASTGAPATSSTPTTVVANPVSQPSAGSSNVTLPVFNGGRKWDTPGIAGASNGQLMGAGNASYNSALIRSLRQNSMTPFSTNPGVQVTPNQGAGISQSANNSITSKLPIDWSSLSPEQKIQYFNTNNITSKQLLSEGVPQSDIDWMLSNGYVGSAAFNPQTLNPRAASDQEVKDWNEYNTYRMNSLKSPFPVLSMSEWINQGKNNGLAL